MMKGGGPPPWYLRTLMVVLLAVFIVDLDYYRQVLRAIRSLDQTRRTRSQTFEHGEFELARRYLQRRRPLNGPSVRSDGQVLALTGPSPGIAFVPSDMLRVRSNVSVALWMTAFDMDSNPNLVVLQEGLIFGIQSRHLRACIFDLCYHDSRRLLNRVLTHVAVSLDFSRGSVDFFVNGELTREKMAEETRGLVTTGTRAQWLASRGVLWVGGDPHSLPPYRHSFVGLLDEVSLWRRPLNEFEIEKLMYHRQLEGGGEAPGLVGYWPLHVPTRSPPLQSPETLIPDEGPSKSIFGRGTAEVMQWRRIRSYEDVGNWDESPPPQP